MTKKSNRTSNKAQREMVDHQRLKAMSSYVQDLDSRMQAIADDISLLVTLQVATDEDKSKIIDMIRKGAEDAKLQGSDESIEKNPAQGELPLK